MLLGATGTGKTATTAWLVEQLQRPTLVMAPNKTLAAQLANEFRELFPDNAVEYFVCYYDYYQPEAYIPQTDTYIEKDSSINEEVERLRHSATNSLLTRRDVIVVATVSCIYGLGTPQEYVDRMVRLRVGEECDRDDLLRRLVEIQYTRNDMAFTRGTFRVRGDTLEMFPVYEEHAVRIEFFGDEVERLMTLHPVTGEVLTEDARALHLPGHPLRRRPGADGARDRGHRGRARGPARRARAPGQAARGPAAAHAHHLRHRDDAPGRLLLRHRELLAPHRRPRAPARRPTRCSTTSPRTSSLVIDESHVTVPQIGGMYEGDMSRKRNLVEHGFRLPSAMDNRPLRWEEFVERIGQTVYLSATPGAYELARVDGDVVEQIIRPTGLVDPEVDREARPRARSTT